MERQGIGAIKPLAGVAMVGAVLRGICGAAVVGSSQLLASVFYWDQLQVDGGFFAELKQAAQLASAAGTAAGPSSGLLATPEAALGQASPSREALAAAVAAALLAVLGSEIAPDEPLMAAGLDSLGVAACCMGTCCNLCHHTSTGITTSSSAYVCRRGGAAQRFGESCWMPAPWHSGV